MAAYKGFKGTFEERFWAKVDTRDFNGCWIWTAGRFKTGYGAIWRDKNMDYAHRVAWEFLVGPIPAGMMIDHDNPTFGCGNVLCVRPDHLEMVVCAKNRQRGRHLLKSNTSGRRGVSWSPRLGKWLVRATKDGREYVGGKRESFSDAVAARDALHIRLFGDVMHEKEKASGNS